MTLKDILAITGQPGLYKLVASSQKGLIVESLETGIRTSVSTTTRVSALEDIAIFTLADDMPLIAILKTMLEKHQGDAAINHKSKPEEIKAYFAQIVPDYDAGRVYVSDMKKVISWYNTLQAANMLDIVKDAVLESDRPVDESVEVSEEK